MKTSMIQLAKKGYNKMKIATIFFIKDTYMKYARPPMVMTIDETLDKLLSGRVSMSRYGDGEYYVIAGRGNGFQKPDDRLAERLKEVLKENKYDDYIVCIQRLEYDEFGDYAKSFWKRFMREHGMGFYSLMNRKNKYYATNVTRLYMDWIDKEKSTRWFDRLKELWTEKDILFVEGEKSRLGIGNDLFANSKSIERIIAPSNNAFDVYDKILAAVLRQSKDKLVLIALGQTATVLAYDLYKAGYWALDVGHVDIEYEWMLRQAKVKIPIPGKFVNEAQTLSEVDDLEDAEYESQIIEKISLV